MADANDLDLESMQVDLDPDVTTDLANFPLSSPNDQDEGDLDLDDDDMDGEVTLREDEEHSVLGLILPDDYADPQFSSDPEYETYLKQLTDASLERISKEPDRLRSERERIQQEIEALAVQHSRSFTQSATHIHEILKEVQKVHGNLESLGKDIPRLASALQKFALRGSTVNEERDINLQTLRQHNVLIEVLELPQLIDTCVRKGAYDEAMMLEQYTKRLVQIHNKSTVVATVADEVRQSADLMLRRLLADLKQSISLPDCMRVVGYIRKLGVHTESQLRLEFLHCRDVWFENILRDVPQSSSYQYLSKLTDRYRVHLFELMTHYRAIFSDDDSASGRGDASLLSSWVLHKLQSYIETLANLLPLIRDGAQYSQLLEQVMYCGMSLGRVGIDFRSFVAPMFESCVRDLFTEKLASARDTILAGAPAVDRWLDPSAAATSNASGDVARGPLSPPLTLLDHPPLAHWCNAYITGLNDLRSCAPISLREELAELVTFELNQLALVLKEECGTLGLSESDRDLLGQVARVVNEQLVPFVAESYDAVYQGARLINHSGPSAVLTKLYRATAAVTAAVTVESPAVGTASV